MTHVTYRDSSAHRRRRRPPARPAPASHSFPRLAPSHHSAPRHLARASAHPRARARHRHPLFHAHDRARDASTATRRRDDGLSAAHRTVGRARAIAFAMATTLRERTANVENDVEVDVKMMRVGTQGDAASARRRVSFQVAADAGGARMDGAGRDATRRGKRGDEHLEEVAMWCACEREV